MAARHRLALAVALLATVLVGIDGSGAADAPGAEATRRLMTLVRGIGEEYREALDAEGRIVRPLEMQEAQLFLAEARQYGRRLGTTMPADLDARLVGLETALARRIPLAEFETEVDAICRAVSEASGVGEETMPPARPSAARGKPIFVANCVSCHGEHGAGDGPNAAQLDRRPANFTDPGFIRGETPSDFFHVVSIGKRLASMPAWDAVLSTQERWDVISYLWTLAVPPADVLEGQGIFLAHCAGCHGAAGDGRGAYRDVLVAAPPDLTAPGALTRQTDAALHASIMQGVPGTPMPGFARTLGEEDAWKAVAYVRRVSLGGLSAGTAAPATGGSPAASAAGGAALSETERLVAAAEAAYRRGEPNAGDLATDAYLRFEPLEPGLRARDPEVVTRVEEAFLRLRGALREPGADVAPLFAAVRDALSGARHALASTGDAWARFVQSLAIILREGLEIVLILGALVASVVQSGNSAMKRPIYGGAALGLVASVATAALIATIFRLTPGFSDVLEGAAMLLAAVVLFWVSYWIVSKAEAERWQRYIRGRVQHALNTGSGVALAAAAFLAVYREGFETVLFYQALLADAPPGDVLVAAGFLAGTAVLGLVYVVFSRLGLRIPIRQFFLASGTFLCAMAVAFAGRGVHELQEAGVLGITPVAWAPQIGVLGVFPTLESLLAQGVLLALVAYGVVVTLRRRWSAEVQAELRRLREQADGPRGEVTSLHTGRDTGTLGTRREGSSGDVRAGRPGQRPRMKP